MHPSGFMLSSMDVHRIAEEVAELYRGIYLHLYQRVDPRLWRPSQESLLVLQHLSATGPLTVMEAARHFDRSQAAMSELVARLIRRGLLASMADERDRRRHLVWLTDEGQEVLGRLTQVLSPELLTQALEHMSPDDRESLIHGMRALLAAAANNARKRGPET